MTTKPERFLSVRDVCKLLRCGRTKFYALVKVGDLKAIKVGHSTRVTETEFRRFCASLPALAAAQGGSSKAPVNLESLSTVAAEGLRLLVQTNG